MTGIVTESFPPDTQETTLLGAALIWCVLEIFQMHFMVSLVFDTLCSVIPAASIRTEAGPAGSAGSAAAAQKRLWPNPTDHCQQQDPEGQGLTLQESCKTLKCRSEEIP